MQKEKLQQFSPSLMAADKPCLQLQPSLRIMKQAVLFSIFLFMWVKRKFKNHKKQLQKKQKKKVSNWPSVIFGKEDTLIILLSAWDRSRDSTAKRNLSNHMKRTYINFLKLEQTQMGVTLGGFLVKISLEPSCCKKQSKKSLPRNWFMEYGI